MSPPMLLLCLALAPLSAQAWESPQKAIDAFLAYELAGGRLQSDPQGLARHVHLDAEHEGIGADTITVVGSHRVSAPQCRGKRCSVQVDYQVPAASHYGDLPLTNGAQERSESVRYQLQQRQGQWRVEATSMSELPYVSHAGLLAHLAGMQADMDLPMGGPDLDDGEEGHTHER